ncbi:MAG TPA: bile acid:sodium symporter [Lacipirellulaceae bacterium]|jgi:BASS family bile acid:Na+ symporter|nr:bile acid:sodium symporter [Lacipirellulaceae bacterium]
MVHAGTVFELYAQFEYPLAAAQLILSMSGMGATLTKAQFQAILRRPQPVVLVLALQYLAFPILAAVVARLANLPPGIALGLVLMNAVPSGSFTNVFTYLGHGNVTLSIVMTCASTAVSFVLTPLVIDWLTAAELPEGFHIPLDLTLYPVVMFLLLPLLAGVLVARFWSSQKHAFAKWAVRASLVPLALIVVGALGSGRIDVTEYGWRLPALLVIFVYASLILTRRLSMLVGYNWSDAFTMGIEVALRNGNLAIALAATLFPASQVDDPVGRAVFFTTLFYAGTSLVLSMISVARRRFQLARLPHEVE